MANLQTAQTNDSWVSVLNKEVDAKGAKTVAKELGISRATVDLVSRGQYGANPAKIIEKIKKIYGNDGQIDCMVLGIITPNQCAETWRKAAKIGMAASNPDTIKLYHACKTCSVRG
jgi:hypothetical protein